MNYFFPRKIKLYHIFLIPLVLLIITSFFSAQFQFKGILFDQHEEYWFLLPNVFSLILIFSYLIIMMVRAKENTAAEKVLMAIGLVLLSFIFFVFNYPLAYFFWWNV